MANNEHITRLFRKYLADDYTKAELDELLRYFEINSDDGQLEELIAQELDGIESLDADRQKLIDSISETIEQRVFSRTRPATKPKLLRWLPYAAAVAIAMAVGWLTWSDRWATGPEQIVDIAPGGNRATLTLADGRTIALSQQQAGIIVGDGITYLDGSTIFGEQGNKGEQVSMATSEPVDGPVRNHKLTSLQVHTLTTPKGGQYQITLPDGSKVWLNANSTLKYPSHFSEDERVVELVGEAYFDVRHETLDTRRATSDSAPESHLKSQISNLKSDGKPFKVISNGQIVEVLGTQFNISAYPDDPETKTTLVEGKVKVALAGGKQAGLTTDDSRLTTHDSRLTTKDLQLTTKILTPGEQATIRGTTIETQQVDLFDHTGWKDGWIVLRNSDIKTVIRQLERWYDVTFDVTDWPEGLRLEGEIQRNSKLSSVVEALELNTGKQLYIEERRVMEKR